MYISLSLGIVTYLPIIFVGLRDCKHSMNEYKSENRVEIGDQNDQVGTRFMHPV